MADAMITRGAAKAAAEEGMNIVAEAALEKIKDLRDEIREVKGGMKELTKENLSHATRLIDAQTRITQLEQTAEMQRSENERLCARCEELEALVAELSKKQGEEPQPEASTNTSKKGSRARKNF
eukprot:TRINITY_DN24429_c0_g1_i1.p1 TRINITY_DN24429_c0_g1~~TRINITY_DN24429_c0_g1_i1.p1  ORF type:complete len:124 (+),score=45.26 TRINITY_DN24429_c0_g1_i1:82-453(+)